MSVYTLDAIREIADQKYGSTDIELDERTTVRLLNPLRLPKSERDALINVQKAIDEDEDGDELTADQGDVFRKALRIVADDKVAVERLLDAIGDDLGILAAIFTTYTEGTSVGEASASAD
jgi:hypothetical protein